ncbi:MAG: PEP-CTERM sorting domain-containing protein [Candidatus Omnitrophica bacterium]|nr:PEP-CTERM sorting domain-containing protein [Candidatus Omnitrophota bacterium]
MMKRLLIILVCGLALSAAFTKASADSIIYDNRNWDAQQHYLRGGALVSDFGWGSPGFPIEWFQLDDFILPGDRAFYLTDIHWWGYYQDPPTMSPASESFTARIYDTDNNGNPQADSFFDVFFDIEVEGTNPRAIGVASGTGVGQQLVRDYEIDLTAIDSVVRLEPNTRYYLAIIANNTPTDQRWSWATTEWVDGAGIPWENWTDSSGFSADYFKQYDPVLGDPPELAFYLTGEIPEPTSMILLAGGLAGWLATRRGRSERI